MRYCVRRSAEGKITQRALGKPLDVHNVKIWRNTGPGKQARAAAVPRSKKATDVFLTRIGLEIGEGDHGLVILNEIDGSFVQVNIACQIPWQEHLDELRRE